MNGDDSSVQKFLEHGVLCAQDLTATVLFVNIRGFTSIAETLPSNQLLPWLNQYFETMTDCIMNHDGMVDKYIGDAIVAVFGAPIPRTTQAEIQADAIAAVQSSLEMHERLSTLNHQLTAQKLPVIDFGIGIHTGPLVGGQVGNRHRLNYSLFGKTISVAAGLQSMTKALPLEAPYKLLVSADTYEYTQSEFSIKYFRTCQLERGSEKMGVYTITERTLSEPIVELSTKSQSVSVSARGEQAQQKESLNEELSELLSSLKEEHSSSRNIQLAEKILKKERTRSLLSSHYETTEQQIISESLQNQHSLAWNARRDEGDNLIYKKVKNKRILLYLSSLSLIVILLSTLFSSRFDLAIDISQKELANTSQQSTEASRNSATQKAPTESLDSISVVANQNERSIWGIYLLPFLTGMVCVLIISVLKTSFSLIVTYYGIKVEREKERERLEELFGMNRPSRRI